jgi:putative transposase
VKRKRFSVERIVAVLKQAEAGTPVAELIRHIGISEQTFYRWKKQYAGLQTDQVCGSASALTPLPRPTWTPSIAKDLAPSNRC